MEESSDQETHNHFHNSDHQSPQNDTAPQNPQSGKTQEGFLKPQSLVDFEPKTMPLSSVDPPEKIDYQVVSGMHQKQQHGEEVVVEGGDDDFDFQDALDEEIRQVIYKESLNEAVMNLALEEAGRGNARERNEVSSFFAVAEDGDGIGAGEVGFERGVNGEAWEGSDGDGGRSENVVAMLGPYGNDGVEGGDEAEENGGFGGIGNFNKKQFQYPLRLDAEDCAFYMKTGNCKFGFHCKFNHPPKRRNQVPRDRLKPRTEDLEHSTQTECKYYLTPGGCKFGSTCKFNHSRERSAVSPKVEFNFLGLPIRPGEKECPYYMRNGSCKYGSNCKFNHPDPTSAAGNDLASGYGNIGSIKLHGAPQSVDIPWSPSPVMLPPSPVVSSNPDWKGYQTASYPSSERSLPMPPAFALNNPVIDANLYSHHQQQMPVDEFPQRPGQPECSYFLRTGDCKYKSNCRFHHPKLQNPQPVACALSEKGLPLRPDQSICSFYNRYGICKFGPACKFDHPENWSKSLTSDGVGMGRSEMQAGFS